ncbi:ribonuclease E inhibitor RraB [Xanthomonas phaseoli]|uniref:Regulator of ribonuclease activity B domain-containing protein n=1 Tax=Xanthomonas phaseoli pv. dieffenbachiae TaxID=92828 RepID=A0A1V9H923_9XANT|nr:ribonuclease E inhibitor RraB [Xanthomonas phaseoli]MBO9790227.1 ribonuclease E inhibitor RraB [Xanthomonas phaseoli pv. dieffenbachiae]MBO9886675.1 ribonuclease E inhibitor RraB [Xanthomonas phaseoli pv. dieffenbachiae]MBO9916569.1 ribonuclease E inhibitor RraB [Xanthomonas phaseoli pv. dieffenbachiae]MBO9940804.1 ribonuclease E inhibitor RraB [Xanthomonas phaseoli pv. dieffenbachiae]MBO9996556.1 ribonuclease E inhibitor RraB [Xanthomonas phaseoli pv. dieffenbachiae]
MQRNLDLYPKDDNGDTLWHIAQQGVDLSKPREIAFSVVFPSKESALEFSVKMLRFEQKVRCCHYPENTAFPMDVTVYPTMAPSYKAISAFEDDLATETKPLGGLNDGWELSVDANDA